MTRQLLLVDLMAEMAEMAGDLQRFYCLQSFLNLRVYDGALEMSRELIPILSQMKSDLYRVQALDAIVKHSTPCSSSSSSFLHNKILQNIADSTTQILDCMKCDTYRVQAIVCMFKKIHVWKDDVQHIKTIMSAINSDMYKVKILDVMKDYPLAFTKLCQRIKVEEDLGISDARYIHEACEILYGKQNKTA